MIVTIVGAAIGIVIFFTNNVVKTDDFNRFSDFQNELNKNNTAQLIDMNKNIYTVVGQNSGYEKRFDNIDRTLEKLDQKLDSNKKHK